MNTDANKKYRPFVLSTNVKNSHPYSEKYFLLCEQCFWCASHFAIEKLYDSSDDDDKNGNNINNTNIISSCPLYDNEKVESMPIANGELYKFDYNSKRGVTVEFYVGIT